MQYLLVVIVAIIVVAAVWYWTSSTKGEATVSSTGGLAQIVSPEQRISDNPWLLEEVSPLSTSPLSSFASL